MKIVTNRNIVFPSGEVSIGFDGKNAGASGLLAFQKWANKMDTSLKLTEDGKYGPKTEAAIVGWGDD